MTKDTFSLDGFTGQARMFPLPNLVVFPHVVQPLHIFESRYVEMLEDAVAGDHLIAMALLLPGWQGQYEGRPPVDPFVCLGRVLSHSPTKDNRYNILLGGIARAKIVQELPAQRSFREVELEILKDVEPESANPQIRELQDELVGTFRKFIPDDSSAKNQFSQILDQRAQLGTLTDLISYSLPLDLAFRQTLLGETDVVQRTKLLLHQLRKHLEAVNENRPFPPQFSAN